MPAQGTKASLEPVVSGSKGDGDHPAAEAIAATVLASRTSLGRMVDEATAAELIARAERYVRAVASRNRFCNRYALDLCELLFEVLADSSHPAAALVRGLRGTG